VIATTHTVSAASRHGDAHKTAKRLSHTPVIAVLVIAAWLGACSSRTQAQTEPDPCRLLTRADVQQALGPTVLPVLPGKHRAPIRPQPGLRFCGYPTVTRFGEIVVAEQRPGRTAFEEGRTRTQQNNSYRPLGGLRDRAFAGYSSVTLLRGDTTLAVVSQNACPEFEPVAVDLARVANNTLP
jgi:hypothetical protein